MWTQYSGYASRLPPSIESNNEWQSKQLTTDEMIEAILLDNNIEKTPIDELERELQRHSVLIRDFLNRFRYDIPTHIKVHVTQYGPGGSYHPLGKHFLSLTHPAISVLDPMRAKHMGKSRWSFPMTLVHEAIHLIIYEPVTLKLLSEDPKDQHDRNEALVDQLCSCNELRPIMGTYPKQKRFVDSLMPNWNELISWKNSPSWSVT